MRQAAWKWFLAVVALWTVQGCNCGQPPVESALAVAFERPTDGARLAVADDADPSAEGFQYDVAVVARDTAGREVTLSRAQLETRQPGSDAWTPGPDAVLEGSRVTFPRTTLQERTNLLKVTVEEQGSKRTVTQTISVAVGSDTPSLEISRPAEGQVLREADDADAARPGYQVAFDVNARQLRGATGFITCGGVCGLAPVPFTVGNDGKAAVVVTLSEPVREAQQAQCLAVVKWTAGDVISPPRGLSLDTEAPRMALASPSGPVASTTFPVVAVVRSVENGVTATLLREGASAQTARVQAGAVTFPAVTVPGDGSYLFRLSLTDAGGNVTERSFEVAVATAAPVFSLEVPASVTVDADGNASNGVQAEALVKVNGLPVGTEVELWTTVTNRLGEPQRARTVASGAEHVARFTLSLAEGANSVKAIVRNVAGTEAFRLASVNVATGRPTCRIVSPDPGTLVGAGAAPVSVRVESMDGAVSLASRQGTSESVQTVEASGGAASFLVQPPASGVWRLVAQCPGGGVSQQLTLQRDITPPTLVVALRDLADGQVGPSFLDTSVLPGTQVVLDATTEPLARVGVTGCGLAAPLEVRADSEGRASVREVTVPDSDTCELSVKAVDLANNEATTKVAVTSALAASTLAFDSPDPRRTLGKADGTALPEEGLAVPVRLSFSSGAKGELKLYRDTAQVGSSAVVAADTGKAFPDVALASGVNVLRAVLSNTAGAGACASALYTVDVNPGAITLTSPGASATFNLTEDRDPTTPGIQRPLGYSLNGASASAVVDMCTSVPLTPSASPCRDGSGWFTLATRVPASTPLFSYPDGTYQLKAVLEDGGRFTEPQQAPVSLVVDGQRPEVVALALVGDTNGDRRLNAQELPSGFPVLRVTTAGLEAGRPLQVRDATTNVIYGQASATGGSVDVTLGSLPSTSEAEYSLVVVLTDAAGNPNKTVASQPADPLDPVNAPARIGFRLDRAAPAPAITAPSAGAVLGPAQDANPAAPGFQLRVSVAVPGADVLPGGVALRLTPGNLEVNATPVDGAVTHDFTVAATGTQLYTLSITARDTSGNESAPVTRTVTVDLEAPTLALESPAAGAVLDDANVQVRARVGGGEGLRVFLYSQPDGGGARRNVGSLLVAGGVAEGVLSFPFGVQDVTAEVTDVAGNFASAGAQDVNVRLTGCDVTLTSPDSTPVTFLARDDVDAATPGLQYTLRGNTTRCGGRTVTLYRAGTPLGSRTADAATGEFSFALSLADGDASQLRVEMVDDALNKTQDFVDYSVDVTPAVISAVSPEQTTLTFVAKDNVHLVPVREPGYLEDLTPGGNAEASFTLTVRGAVGGKVQTLYRGAPASQEYGVTTEPQTIAASVVLPHGTSGTLALKVLDASGNETVHNISANVDVLAPAGLTPTLTIPAGAERKASLDVTWAAGGDDGAQGQASGYDVRWSTQALLDKGVTDEATYFGPRMKRVTGGLVAADVRSQRLTVPPLGTYLVGVRPVDDVGNISPLAVTAKEGFTAVTLQNPGAAGRFGFLLASGDLDGDGKTDLVTSDDHQSTANRGIVYVYYDLTSATGRTPQTLLPPGTGGQQFGLDVAVGNVGDAAGEGRPDVVVGSPSWASSRGRAFLYFGRSGQPLDATPIEFRGRAGAPAATNFGYAARIVRDLDGDGLDEVLFSAHGEVEAVATPMWKGRVYLFFGRSRAAWQALATGLEADSVPFVPVDAADLVFDGPPPASSTGGTDRNTFFGRRRGHANVGDLDGDGKPELTLSAPYDKYNAVYVYSSKVLASRRAGAGPTERTVKLADVLQTLTRTGAGALNGFGVEVVGGQNFTGGAAKDLVVTHPISNLLRLFPDGGATGFTDPNPELTIGVFSDPEVPSPRFFGYTVLSADLNEDGFPDLICGEGAANRSSAWILFHRGGSTGSPFDRMAGGLDTNVPGDGFSHVRFKGLKSLGTGVVVGDFNGDGALDLAAGDTFDTPGKVLVWY